MTDLGALRLQAYLDSAGRVREWAQSFVAGAGTDTLSLLKDISAGVATQIAYETREDDGAQSPDETLARRSGSCRDFAVLFVDAVRSLGFGARIVSGYLYDPDLDMRGSAGAGSTHAWAEVYVPGAGWITFDPTNRSVGGFNLIPVAMARHISQTMPVSGSFAGDAGAFLGLEVTVTVAAAEGDRPACDGLIGDAVAGPHVGCWRGGCRYVAPARWIGVSDPGTRLLVRTVSIKRKCHREGLSFHWLKLRDWESHHARNKFLFNSSNRV